MTYTFDEESTFLGTWKASEDLAVDIDGSVAEVLKDSTSFVSFAE